MGYQWEAGEGIADGFRRIATDELTEAIDGLSDPQVQGVEVTVYLDADVEPERASDLLQETLRRCPVTQTLLRGTTVQTRLRT